VARNKNGQRKVVVPIRETGGNSVLAVFNTISQAASFIRAHVAKGTVVRAGEAACWDKPYERFEVTRINHQEAYHLDGACVDMAEEYFSRLRRAETGIHHPIAGAYRLRYVQESSWRDGHLGVSISDQVSRGACIEARRKPVDFSSCRPRHNRQSSGQIRPLQDNRLPSIHQTLEAVVDDFSHLAGMLSFIC